jgi:hypothetical protein
MADIREIHFLHIGKCAGTQIKAMAEKINASAGTVRIIPHRHSMTLSGLPPAAEYFFSIRSPETRFVSGFYSRKRKGWPRYNVEWTRDERAAFETFEHATDLAEAIFAEGARGQQAFAAVRAIEHLAINQIDYFKWSGSFLLKRPPVAIIRQENFERDIAALLRKLGINSSPLIETDPVAAHRNAYADVKPLSDQARENIRKWYTQDIELYRQCTSWLQNAT